MGQPKILNRCGALRDSLAAEKFFCNRDLGLAEGEGFEPSIRFPVYTRSRRAPSTTRPPLRRLRRSARHCFVERSESALRTSPARSPLARAECAAPSRCDEAVVYSRPWRRCKSGPSATRAALLRGEGLPLTSGLLQR